MRMRIWLAFAVFFLFSGVIPDFGNDTAKMRPMPEVTAPAKEVKGVEREPNSIEVFGPKNHKIQDNDPRHPVIVPRHK